jgi:hypothetical protein
MSATDTVLLLTREMAEAAAAGEWEHVAHLEAERRAPLAQIVNDATEETRATIEDILRVDAALRDAAERARASVAGELAALRSGRQALTAYGEIAAG